jgi:cell division septum initiation protein DivIVA
MGALTKDMTRLCEEIQTLRAGRHELKKELAQRTKARQVEVLETCAAFTEARNWKAESAHTTRQNFVENLKQAVAEQGKSLRDDLSTARRVWGRLRTA